MTKPFPFWMAVRISASARSALPVLANRMARVLVTTPPRSSGCSRKYRSMSAEASSFLPR